MTSRFILMAAAGGAALLPALAAAQPSSDPRAERRMRAGPVYFAPSLTGTRIGYDTNVYNETGDPQPDLTFTVVPGADVWLPLARRGMISASVHSDLVYYRELASERAVNRAADLRGELYARRLTLFGEGGYASTRQRQNLEIDTRPRHVTRSLRAGVDVRLLPKLFAEVSARYSTIAYDPGEVLRGTRLADVLDRDTRGGAVNFRWVASPLTTLTIGASADEDLFAHSRARDARRFGITAGVDFQPRALVSGSARVGVRQLLGHDDRLPAYRGVMTSGTLTARLSPTTSVSGTASRDVEYSIEPDRPYFVRNGYGASVTRRLGPKFDVTLGAARHWYDYRGFDLAAPEDRGGAARRDTTAIYSASLGYRFSRDGRIGFGTSYWQRGSTTVEAFEYDRLWLGTTIDYGF